MDRRCAWKRLAVRGTQQLDGQEEGEHDSRPPICLKPASLPSSSSLLCG